MYFEVYADSMLLFQFVMNYYLLRLVNSMLHQTVSRRRIVCGAFGGAVLSMIPLLLPVKIIYCMGMSFFLSVFSMSIFTFRTYRRECFLLVLEKLFVSTMLMGGGLIILLRILPKGRATFLRVTGILVAGGVLYKLLSGFIKRNEGKECVCKVTLFGKKKVIVEALLDTGNGLVEPISGAPVAVLDKETFEEIFGDAKPSVFRIIPYHSIGKRRGVLPAYQLDKIRVEMKESTKEYEKVFVGISDEVISEANMYKMILHPGILR